MFRGIWITVALVNLLCGNLILATSCCGLAVACGGWGDLDDDEEAE